MTEIVEQMAQATRKPPFDIWQGDDVLVWATRSFNILARDRARSVSSTHQSSRRRRSADGLALVHMEPHSVNPNSGAMQIDRWRGI